MLKQTDKELKSLVNKYLYQESIKNRAISSQVDLKKQIVKYLKDKGKEEIKITIQKTVPVIVSNRVKSDYLLKDDAASHIRRNIPANLLEHVIITKDIVDMVQLRKLVDMGKVEQAVMDEIMTEKESEEFNITPV